MSVLTIRRAPAVTPIPMAAPPVGVMVARGRATVQVFLMESAMQLVWNSVDVTRGLVERGGALAGLYGIDAERGRFIVITDAVPAPNALGSRASIEIRAQDWCDIYGRLASLPETRLLGWYHSHPGLGLRLSDTDRETHRRMFDVDWQVALVVDPCSGRFRVYRGRDARCARWVAITANTASCQTVGSLG